MTPSQSTGGSRSYLILIAASAALGGLLFGYDTAVISGAIGFLKNHFQLAADMTGWAASSLLLGCMGGALLGGPLADKFGRKPILILCAVIFALSGLGSAMANDLDLYTWSRLFGGLGIGAVSVLSPLYLAEVAPERVRGRLVSLYQLAIVIGILVSFFVNMLIQQQGDTQPWVSIPHHNVVKVERAADGKETLTELEAGLYTVEENTPAAAGQISIIPPMTTDKEGRSVVDEGRLSKVAVAGANGKDELRPIPFEPAAPILRKDGKLVSLRVVQMESWNTSHGWRWMLGVLVAPSVLFGLFLLPLPESPRWLMKRGLRAEAEKTLARIGGAEAAAREIAQIESSLGEEEGKLSELFKGGYGMAMLIGVALAVFSQFGGVNAIMYYGPELFKTAGASVDSAFLSTVILGVTNLVSTFGAILLVDKIGRKTLLVIGVSIQVLSLVVVGSLYLVGAAPWLLLVFIMLFLIGYSGSTGAVTWVVISEIFPNKLRGQAMGIVVLALWGADYIISQTFPMLKDGIGPGHTFFCYALCCFLGLLFTIFKVPETKNRTLEEIERSWKCTP